MIRTIVTPANQDISIHLPIDYVGKKLELILFAVDEPKEEKIDHLKHEFEKYKEIWERDTRFSSNTTDMINHPAYNQIISLGQDVVPLLLRDMVDTGNHWFEALNILLGINPVLPEHRGKIQQMMKDWVQWAKDNNVSF